MVNPSFKCLQGILLSGTSWAGPVKCCGSSNNHCAPSQFWRWPPSSTGGAMWLYDRQLQRIIPLAGEKRSMAVLVGSKQLARIQGDDALGCITEVLLSLPEGDDNVAADARHNLDALGPEPVVEARSPGQHMVIVSARSPGPARVDVVGEIAQHYGWKLLARGKPSFSIVRWPRLLHHLSASWTDGQFLSRCPSGTRRSETSSVVPLAVHWQVRFSTT